jgi:phosphopantetheinyl transferase
VIPTQAPRMAPRAESLEAGELHLWRARLDAPGLAGDIVLSDAERDRAGRFRFEGDRVRWSRARAILRRLLGDYLERDPRAIELEAGANGKPRLLDGEGLAFNLSHSGHLALFAFTLDNPVGVDVELGGRARDHLAIAERVLGAEAIRRLRELPPHLREPEFLRSWVRHEAALKCRGERLGADPRAEELCLVDLPLDRGAAAVAITRKVATVRRRDLDGAWIVRTRTRRSRPASCRPSAPR